MKKSGKKVTKKSSGGKSKEEKRNLYSNLRFQSSYSELNDAQKEVIDDLVNNPPNIQVGDTVVFNGFDGYGRPKRIAVLITEINKEKFTGSDNFNVLREYAISYLNESFVIGKRRNKTEEHSTGGSIYADGGQMGEITKNMTLWTVQGEPKFKSLKEANQRARELHSKHPNVTYRGQKMGLDEWVVMYGIEDFFEKESEVVYANGGSLTKSGQKILESGYTKINIPKENTKWQSGNGSNELLDLFENVEKKTGISASFESDQNAIILDRGIISKNWIKATEMILVKVGKVDSIERFSDNNVLIKRDSRFFEGGSMYTNGGRITPSDIVVGRSYNYLLEPNTKVKFLKELGSNYIFTLPTGEWIAISPAELEDSISLVDAMSDGGSMYARGGSMGEINGDLTFFKVLGEPKFNSLKEANERARELHSKNPDITYRGVKGGWNEWMVMYGVKDFFKKEDGSVYAEGGVTGTELSPEEISQFETVFNKYVAKDYFGTNELIENKEKFRIQKAKEGDELAIRTTRADIENMFRTMDYKNNLNYFTKLKGYVDAGDHASLKKFVRPNQKFTIALMEIITGKDLKGYTSQVKMDEFIDTLSPRMAKDGKIGGRGFFGLKKGKRIIDTTEIKKGDIILGHSNQFNADNTYKVVGIRTYGTDAGKVTTADVVYWDARADKRIGDEDMSITSFSLSHSGEEYYFPATHDNGGGDKDYVIVGKKGDFYTVISKPTSKKFAETNFDLFTRGLPTGEVGKIMTVKELLAVNPNKVLGIEYLAMEHGGDIYAEGGSVVSGAEVSNIHRNIMGTTDFDMKIAGMRKPQDFVVYPVQKGEGESKKITIQSDTRIGVIDLNTGLGMMSQSHPSGAYFMHLSLDKKTFFKLSDVDTQALRMHIFSTAGASVGDRGLVSDNSGATRLLAEGGTVGHKYAVGQILTDNPKRHESNSRSFDGKRHYYVVVKPTTDKRTDNYGETFTYYPTYWVNGTIETPYGEGLGSFSVSESDVMPAEVSSDDVKKVISRYERLIEIGKQWGGAREEKETLSAIKSFYKIHALDDYADDKTRKEIAFLQGKGYAIDVYSSKSSDAFFEVGDETLVMVQGFKKPKDIALAYFISGMEEPISKKMLRHIASEFKGMNVTLYTNAGVEVHSKEMKDGAFEGIKIMRVPLATIEKLAKGGTTSSKWIVMYSSKETGGMREQIFTDKALADKFAESVDSEAIPIKYEKGGKVGKGVNTVYYISKEGNDSKPAETIYSTTVFDKDDLQKRFDEEAKKLNVGEMLEYGKYDDYEFSPNLLLVEMRKHGLVSFTNSGRTKAYTPKYGKGGAIPNNYAGKFPSHIWGDLNKEQRIHFLLDHSEDILDKSLADTTWDEIDILKKNATLPWHLLPSTVSTAFENHVGMGQYGKGGKMKVKKVVKKKKVVKA